MRCEYGFPPEWPEERCVADAVYEVTIVSPGREATGSVCAEHLALLRAQKVLTTTGYPISVTEAVTA